MKLPNLEQALISEAKIVRYLLSETHPKGKSKAAFFLRFGFSVAEWEVMKVALLEHVTAYEVVEITEMPFGVNYVIEGEISTPDERNPKIRVVWCIETDSDMPHLVTAYPTD